MPKNQKIIELTSLIILLIFFSIDLKAEGEDEVGIVPDPVCQNMNEQLTCSGSAVQPGSNLNNEGANVANLCRQANEVCKKITTAGTGAAAGVGQNAIDASSDREAQNTAGNAGGAQTIGGIIAGLAGQDCQRAINACESTINGRYETARNNFATQIRPLQSNEQTAGDANACVSNANSYDIKLRQNLSACKRATQVIATSNKLTGFNSLAAGSESNSIAKALSGSTGALLGGAALGAGAMYLMNDDDDKDDKKDDDGNAGFSVSENLDGGYCVHYGKDQAEKKCYDNTQLSKICYTSSQNNQPAYPYPNVMQNEQTNKMKDALCESFKADTREGGGGDSKTCFTNKAEYFKEEACQARMITQCQNTDFGDCAKFNDFFCYNDDKGKGIGSNYCVYRESKDYCQNGGNTSSPSCIWMKQMAELGTNGGSSCMANINQATCFPSAYGSAEQMEMACTNLGIKDKDPLCKNLRNEKTYFSWRNPGTPGGAGNLANNGGSSNDPNSNSRGNVTTVDACAKPAMDCTQPANRSAPACVTYYCCQPRNSSAPICQSLSFATASAAGPNGGVSAASAGARYPAGSLPSDISTYRSESIFTASGNSAVRQLCSKGELYDCGTLSGYFPK